MEINAFLNMSRTLLNIAFPLITYPYITRILSPVGIGQYEFSKSIVSYFILISALGITQYAIREGAAIRNDKNEASKLYNEVFSLNIYSTIVAYMLLFFTLAVVTSLHQYTFLILIFSLQMFFSTISVEWLFNIYEDFAYITIRSFIVQIISVLLMFMFVKTEKDVVIYTWITTLSTGGAYIFNYMYAKKYTQLHIVSLKKVMPHLKSVMTLFFVSIASTIYMSSDVTIIGFISGNYYVGIYSIAVKIYTITRQLTTSMLSTTIPKASLYFNSNRIKEYNLLLNNILGMLLTFVLPSVIGILFLKTNIVSIIAGNSYSASSTSLGILAVGLLFSVISSFIINAVLLVQRKEDIILKIATISAIVNIVLNLVMVPFFQERGAAVSTVISEILMVILGYHYTKNLCLIKLPKNEILGIIFGCLGVIIVCTGIKIVFDSNLLVLIGSIILSILIYGIILKLFKAFPKISL